MQTVELRLGSCLNVNVGVLGDKMAFWDLSYDL